MNLMTLGDSSRRFVCKLLAVICSPGASLLRQRQRCSGTDIDAGASSLFIIVVARGASRGSCRGGSDKLDVVLLQYQGSRVTSETEDVSFAAQ